MDALLIVLGTLGLGAVVISTYVFTVAARTYVSEDQHRYRTAPQAPGTRFVERSPIDRRSGRPVTFPLTVNGILIAKDRRVLPDRRRTAC